MAEHRKSQRYNTLGERWFRDQFEAHLPWLEALDEHPKPLEDFLEAHPTRLLGKRFELLIRFWLEQSPHFRLHASGVPLYDAGKTVGEVDFILEEVDSGTWTHLEVACKFYLGYNNSKQWHDWRGPNAQDTLKLKMDKLDRQLSSLETPAGQAFLQEKRWHAPAPALLMKGYLLHHYRDVLTHNPPSFSHPGYPAGFWFWLHEAQDFFRSEGWWVLLPKRSWLAPVWSLEGELEVLDNHAARGQLAEAIHTYRRGVMLVAVERRGNMIEERMRGFVVPNAWPGK